MPTARLFDFNQERMWDDGAGARGLDRPSVALRGSDGEARRHDA